MRWSDLTSEQQRLLAAWFILADASLPDHDEEIPLEAAQALYHLAITTGKRDQFRTGVPQDLPRRSPPTLSNRKRIVRRRKAVGQLAS